MRRKLILNYLCLSALSIIYQYPSCIAQAADSATSSPSNRVYKVEEEPKSISDENRDRKNQRRQLIDRQIPAAPVRRKRELGSLRLQGSSNPSGEQRFAKRSDRQAGIRSSRKLSGSSKNDEPKLNSVARLAAEVPQNRGNQDKQRFASKGEEEREARRSLHSISKVSGSNDAARSYLEDEEPEENFEEYSDEEDELDLQGNGVSGGYKDREEDREESESDKENVADYDESEGPEMVKRETEEDYEDVDEACGAVDEESGREEIPEAKASIERRKRHDDKRSDGGSDSPEERSKREERPEAAAETATEEPNETGDNSSVKKEVKIEIPAEAEDSGADGARRKSDKTAEPNSEYEKKIADEIQQRIDSIKEEIKRDLEEREKIRDIEINNAKFDELQSEADEDEGDEGLDAVDSDPEKTPLKRSTTGAARADKRRARRSGSKDLALQLRAVEGVEKLGPDDFRRAELRHESIKKRSAPIFGAVDAIEPLEGEPGSERTENRRIQSPMIIPEQARVKIEDEVPPGISVDPDLILNSEEKDRLKRSPVPVNRFARRRRASAVVPEGRVAFLGYRPDQEEDDDEEGGEFEDDGFQDRTSNLRQEKSYYADTRNEEASPGSYFLFPGVDQGRDGDLMVRRKRAGVHGGGATVGRRRARGKAKQLQKAKIASRRENSMDRDKRQAGIDTRSYDRASLVGSSQELSPRLATEYKEAFGGLQSDPGGALARFKRVKRGVIRGS